MHDAKKAQVLEKDVTWTANDELMSAEEWAEKDRLDREAHQQYWEDKGREEAYQIGFQEGLEAVRKEVAKNMISMHLPDEMIIKATGLSADVVASLHAHKQEIGAS